MHSERRSGIVYSVVLHLLLIIIMIFGLPSFLRSDPPIMPDAITVEILPISELSNVKPSDAPKADKANDEPEKEMPKPTPPVKTAEAPPTPPEPEPLPTPTPPKPEIKKPDVKKVEKVEPPKPPKKEEKKEIKKTETDLDAILKSVKNDAAKEKTTEKKEPPKERTSDSPKAASSRFDPSQTMSLSEKDAIIGQLSKCWSAPAGAKNAHELIIVINAQFNSDGSYIKAEIASESMSRYNSDSFFRAAADAALRAVKQCSPLKGLSPDKYATWGSMELHFDPRDLL